jgi:hypothetical protein
VDTANLVVFPLHYSCSFLTPDILVLRFNEYRWFRQSKFPSFQRQLNLYGFKRLTSGKFSGVLGFPKPGIALEANVLSCLLLFFHSTGRDKGGYYHERFLRSKPFLSHYIQRTKIKGKGPRKPSSPMTEPDFYNAPYLPPASEKRGIPFLNGVRPSVPSMNPAPSAGSMSLRRLIGAPAPAPGLELAAGLQHQQQVQHAAGLQHHQQALQPPQYNISHLQHGFQAHQAHLEHLRLVSLYQNMQGLSSYGQQSLPTMYGRPSDPSTTMAAALSRSNQDQATFAQSGFWGGAALG